MGKNFKFNLLGKTIDLKILDKNKFNNLEKALNCSSYFFIGDTSTKVYHDKNCHWLELIDDENIQGCGRYPEKNGFKPCPDCKAFSSYYRIKELDREARFRFSDAKKLSKGGVMERSLENICQGFGFHGKISGGSIHITTVAGEWYFLYNDRPIRLRHKNKYGKQGFHSQSKTFHSPVDALIYIRNHEYYLIEKGLIDENRKYDQEIDL